MAEVLADQLPRAVEAVGDCDAQFRLLVAREAVRLDLVGVGHEVADVQSWELEQVAFWAHRVFGLEE